MDTTDIPQWWRDYVWELMCREAFYLWRGMPVAGPWGSA